MSDDQSLVQRPRIVIPDAIHEDRGPDFTHAEWNGQPIDGCGSRTYRLRTPEDDDIQDA